MGHAAAEKRSSPRVAVALSARARIGNRHVKDAVADLSAGGLYLETRERAPVGTPVRVALALPVHDAPCICTLVGTVAWRELDALGRQKGLGVAFHESEMAPADRTSLRGYISNRKEA